VIGALEWGYDHAAPSLPHAPASRYNPSMTKPVLQPTTTPAYRRVSFAAEADPAAVVAAGPARFTVLTSRLIRMEYSPDGRFEDRPSQVFWYRRQPVPTFRVDRDGSGLTLTTDHLRLIWRGGLFADETLSVTLLPQGPTWRYGDAATGNLRGTRRTLDTIDGAAPLELGLLSRDGWTIVDDSHTLVFDAAGWLCARDAVEGSLDLYFLGYGRAFHDCLRDYAAVSGPVPLLPRWALGNWWSRYWAYSAGDLKQLMTGFREHDVPLSVCIIDMDWHLVDVGPGVNGWTGYTWNNDLFPDPAEFIDWLHRQGLRTALNLHPALGIRPHESAYAEMCARLDLDPAAGEAIPFDIADPRFAAAYFEVLHHPQEALGVDFWWMDWQQGTASKLAGLDPLWWLNHLHFYDLARDGKRPFIFSRWGGLGNQRYPIGFSGDTVVSWASLAFQPYMTATAANVAYSWWSHDIGGHMQGIEDGELFTRWVQFGVFSPILRLHSTKNPFHERRPWGYDAEVLRVTRDAMQLRHALIPYLYTLSWLNERQALAPVRPMYHDFPEREEAYACPGQYFFGPDLIAAPYTAPADPDTHLSRQVVWLPPGEWFDFFSGAHYSGDAWHARYGAPGDIPVFARAGAIVPLGPRAGWGGVGNPADLHLHVFAGADGRFVLYEDDGETTAYRAGAYALSRFEQRYDEADGGRLRLLLAPPEGDRSVVPAGRRYVVHVHGVAAPGAASLLMDGATKPLDWTYDEARETARLDLPMLPGAATITLLAAGEYALCSHRDRRRETALAMIAAFRLDSVVKANLAARLEGLLDAPGQLADYGVDMTVSQTRALVELLLGAGVHYVPDAADPHLLVLWNNQARAGFRHRFAQVRPIKWYLPERYQSSTGETPRFLALRPEGNAWQLQADYFGLATVSLDGAQLRSD